MATKLKNRRAAEAKLGGFLKRVALDPRHASVICDGAVDDAFVEAVAALDETLGFAAESHDDVSFSRDWRSCRDLAPLMELVAPRLAGGLFGSAAADDGGGASASAPVLTAQQTALPAAYAAEARSGGEGV